MEWRPGRNLKGQVLLGIAFPQNKRLSVRCCRSLALHCKGCRVNMHCKAGCVECLLWIALLQTSCLYQVWFVLPPPGSIPLLKDLSLLKPTTFQSLFLLFPFCLLHSTLNFFTCVNFLYPTPSLNAQLLSCSRQQNKLIHNLHVLRALNVQVARRAVCSASDFHTPGHIMVL